MRQYSFHWILACAYFLIPVFAIQSGEFTQLQHIDLNFNVLESLRLYLLGSLVSIIVVGTLVDRSLRKKIEWSINQAAGCNYRVVEMLLICCICGLCFFALEIVLAVGSDMSREERFLLLEGSTGAGFMIFVKAGAFLSALSLVLRKRFLPYVFIGVLAVVAFITLSRSVLVVVLLTIFPFMRISWWKGVGGLLLVFFSRLLFTVNFDFSYEWLFTFGLGEMVGVTFGPYMLLISQPALDWYDHFRFMLHVLPGLSLLNRLDGGFPELTVFVNEIADRDYGIYGVAGTGYVDLLVSPPTFIFCCSLLLMIFAYVKYCKQSGISWRVVFSLYCASCMSMISLYRWSLSGYLYSMIRDALMFFVIMLVINRISFLSRIREKRVSEIGAGMVLTDSNIGTSVHSADHDLG